MLKYLMIHVAFCMISSLSKLFLLHSAGPLRLVLTVVSKSKNSPDKSTLRLGLGRLLDVIDYGNTSICVTCVDASQ